MLPAGFWLTDFEIRMHRQRSTGRSAEQNLDASAGLKYAGGLLIPNTRRPAAGPAARCRRESSIAVRDTQRIGN